MIFFALSLYWILCDDFGLEMVVILFYHGHLCMFTILGAIISLFEFEMFVLKSVPR